MRTMRRPVPLEPAYHPRMTKGPIRLDVAVGYAVPRAGIPAAVSFRKWVAAALAGRIREADLAVRAKDDFAKLAELAKSKLA